VISIGEEIVVMAMMMAIFLRITAEAMIGPAFGVKGCNFAINHTAKANDHIAQNMVFNNAQAPVFKHLHRRMAIANVPGHAGRRNGAGTGNGQNRFGGGTHYNNATIGQFQMIAIAQTHRMGQIQQKGRARIIKQANAPPVPVSKSQRYRPAHFGGMVLPDGNMFNGAPHDPAP
jgi:hypothetical protein